MTPREVIERYFETLYNDCNLDLIPELIGDPVIRHHPGGNRTLSIYDSLDRLEVGFDTYPSQRYSREVVVADGEFVAVAWNGHVERVSGEPEDHAGIEIFRVVDGKIREIWLAQEQIGEWSDA